MRSLPLPLRAAFTLVELLVVITIIAILAAIIVPVMGKVTETANATKCVSNLRQIATAIGAYSGDNDDALPGPLSLAQYPRPGANAEALPGSLITKLAKYLQMPTTSADPASSDRFNPMLCPSYEKAVLRKDGPSFLINPDQISQLEQTPWGNVDEGKEPVRKSVLTTLTETTSEGKDQQIKLARIWAMKDADREGAGGVSAGNMAMKPVHGDHRNALFYDWHVEKMPLDDRAFSLAGQ